MYVMYVRLTRITKITYLLIYLFKIKNLTLTLTCRRRRAHKRKAAHKGSCTPNGEARMTGCRPFDSKAFL